MHELEKWFDIEQHGLILEINESKSDFIGHLWICSCTYSDYKSYIEVGFYTKNTHKNQPLTKCINKLVIKLFKNVNVSYYIKQILCWLGRSVDIFLVHVPSFTNFG